MAKITASQIIFDSEDFLAGFAKSAAIKAVFNKSNQLVSNLDPFRDYGILQPGRKAVDATNNSSLGGVMVAGAVKNATLSYGVDSSGKFHEYNFATNTITTGSFPYTITGTSPVGQDVVIYKHNSSSTPVFSVFYSYYNNANWDVGAYVNYTGTPDHDFMSTIPATPLDITTGDGDDTTQRTLPHTMEVGADDILYIGSGRYLHAYDGATGANGTFSSKVLTLPQGFVIKALQKYKDRLLIAGVYSSISGNPDITTTASGGEALVYVWDYVSLDVNEVIPLDDPIVYSIFMWRGLPHVITGGESEGFGTLNGTKVKMINGDTAVKVAELSGDVAVRGVDGSSRVLYLNANGKIYAVGDNVQDGYQVNQLMSCAQTGVGGWLKNIITYGVIASGSTGSTHSMSAFPTSNFASSARFVTSYYNIPTGDRVRGKVKSVVVEYFNTVTDAKAEMTMQLVYDMNAGSPNSAVVQNLNTVAAPAQKVYYVDTSGNPLQQFSSIGIDITWSEDSGNANATAPAISRVIINYEPINI